MRTAIPALLVLLVASPPQAQQLRAPSIDQVIDLRRPGAVALSPDGTRIAFTSSMSSPAAR